MHIWNVSPKFHPKLAFACGHKLLLCQTFLHSLEKPTTFSSIQAATFMKCSKGLHIHTMCITFPSMRLLLAA